jgi:hypothetical protein
VIAGESEPLDIEAHRAAWRTSASFDELLVLGAAFLGRSQAYFPGWGSPSTDAETDAIVGPLLGLNRLGFLSVASQPGFEGRRDGRDVRQRAFVIGFAKPVLAARWAAASAIEVRTWSERAASRESTEEPMTLEDDVARVVAGHAARDEELALFEGEIGARALADLRAATFVAAWDPVFGREHVLWDELLRLGNA